MHVHKPEVLLLKLWFSILIIPVQAPLLGHVPTTIPPTQCTFMIVNISVNISATALESNGFSKASPALGSSLTAPRLMTPTNLCMCVLQ
jgi:hypothetical protein